MSDDVRELVAAEAGLSPEAATFLSGSTLAEVEASAVEFRQLLGESQERQHTAADPFAAAAEGKRRKQTALRAAVTGRPAPQRDERGRLEALMRTPVYPAYRDSGAGARQPAARPRDPEREHGQLIARMASGARARALGL